MSHDEHRVMASEDAEKLVKVVGPSLNNFHTSSNTQWTLWKRRWKGKKTGRWGKGLQKCCFPILYNYDNYEL